MQSKYHLSNNNDAFNLFELGPKEFYNLPEKFKISFSKLFDFPGNGSFQRARLIFRNRSAAIALS